MLKFHTCHTFSAFVSLSPSLSLPPSLSLSLTLPLSISQLSLKCRAPEVSQYVYQMYDSILKN